MFFVFDLAAFSILVFQHFSILAFDWLFSQFLLCIWPLFSFSAFQLFSV